MHRHKIKMKIKIHKISILLTFIFLAANSEIKAQGSVNFQENGNITSLMEQFLAFNLQNAMIPGFKIQIISTTDRREMDETRQKFSSLYPTLPVSWKHIAPNYQVRVGAYRTKSDLMAVINDIRRNFPMSTPVADMIDKKDLITY